MRTIDRLASTAALTWLRGRAGRVRWALMARSPGVRLALALAAALLLMAAGYWAAGTLSPSGPRYLSHNRQYSSDDLLIICKALDARGISYRPVDRMVEVAADQYDQAASIVGKLNVGPQPIDALREPPDSFRAMWEPAEVREQRERLGREKMIERIIDDLDGVVWSVVSIQHPRGRLSRPSRARPSAFVYLECERNRPLPEKTVQAIPLIVTGLGLEPELSTDAITVMDRTGRLFLDQKNPDVGKLTRDRAREQELRERVAEQLSWIDGVRVAAVVLTDHRRVTAHSRPAEPSGEAEDRGESPPSIAVNQPADLGATARPSPPPAQEPDRGRVFVYVPRSYYILNMLPGPEHREPTVQELREAAARIKGQIERTVKPLIPESWTLDVDTIPDKVEARPALAAGPEHRRIAADWGIIGAVGASVALLLATGSWIQAARRPARAIGSPPTGRRYREDAADEPGPSERVRELVRRDPEVAASVLQRWATQGGRAS